MSLNKALAALTAGFLFASPAALADGISNPGGSSSLTVGTTPVTSGSSGCILFDTSGAKVGCDSKLTYAGAGGQVNLQPAANTNQPLLISGGSITGSSTSTLGYAVTGTLNTSGVVPGVVIFANITNTASGAGTSLLDLQVGGASKFAVLLDSTVKLATNAVMDFGVSHSGAFTIQPDTWVGGSGTPTSNQGPLFRLGSILLGGGVQNGIFWTTNGSNADGAGALALTELDNNTLQINNTGSGTFRDLKLRNLIATATIQPQGFLVSTLPASPPQGSIAFVTDAVACTFLATLTGGSSTYCPVTFNGSAWVGG